MPIINTKMTKENGLTKTFVMFLEEVKKQTAVIIKEVVTYNYAIGKANIKDTKKQKNIS